VGESTLLLFSPGLRATPFVGGFSPLLPAPLLIHFKQFGDISISPPFFYLDLLFLVITIQILIKVIVKNI
jgi:hypothetical protein